MIITTIICMILDYFDYLQDNPKKSLWIGLKEKCLGNFKMFFFYEVFLGYKEKSYRAQKC